MSATRPLTGTARALRWLAIGIVAVCFAMLVFLLASLVLPGRSDMPGAPSPLGLVCWPAVFFAFPIVGGVVAVRRPEHPIGWLFLVIALGLTMSVFSTEYVGRALFLGWSLPAVPFIAWLGNATFLPATGLAMTLVPLLFPDGRFLGRGWRVLGWLAVIAIVLGAVSQALAPGFINGFDERVVNPIAVPAELGDALVQLSNLAFVALALIGIASIASLGVRYRRGGRVERAQIKWFASAVAAFLLAFAVAFVTQVNDLFTIATGLLALLPIATGMAILRYHLFDIDRIVSRTLGWLLVTVILLTLFAAAILVAQALLEPVTGGSTIGVAVSTLVVAASFTPVRRRVQRVVDRRFNRARYDAERTAGAFAGRLRDEVDLGTIATDLAGTVRDTLAPASLGVWLVADRDPRS
ncbi:MAG: hypothetical protein U0869_17085 [Chloroflexota bacterium]